MATDSSRLADYLAARPYSRAEVLAKPSPVPAERGVYGWWFRRLPAEIDAGCCATKDGLTLLYIGIGPSKPPSNGKAPSRQTIRSRIRTHYTGNAAGSTLRLTLGCLLSDELGIELRLFGSGKRLHFGRGERLLSQWMHENALVSWITDTSPWVLEDELIATLDVPLNLQGNAWNGFHAFLTAARWSAARMRATGLPVLANPGVGGRWP
ncbi:GIY-YIG nuclease family protein [Nocardia mexicana]|uniref:GIY-YIG nuclease family protein n=1 Tax=Nocardia mexicana TaxID=279262 RepID=UPI001FE544FF|nr:hypothetical protein [Nocardia mexicana]